MKRIAVIGLGLMGGSFCYAIKKKFSDVHITAYGKSPERMIAARDVAVVDEVCHLNDFAFNGEHLVFVSVPVCVSVEIIKHVLDCLSEHSETIVTDAGSVKHHIERELSEHRNFHRFIGSHPMTGSEQSGFAAACPELYENASVIVTPHKKNALSDIDCLCQLWQTLGAHVTVADAVCHDRMVAYTSHLAHIVSCILVSAADKNRLGEYAPYIGPGFRDMTRLASGSPPMWSDIVSANRENIKEMLCDYRQNLDELISLIGTDAGDKAVAEFFEKVAATKNAFGSSLPDNITEV